MKKEVDISDLKKIELILHEAYMFHLHRDEMNARGHLAKKTILSPLTIELEKAWERIDKMIQSELTLSYE